MVKQIHREFKIYTKRGDKGFTYLFNGKKIKKDNNRVQAYGNIDELNSIVGILIAFLRDKQLKKELICVQKDLFLVGGYLAKSIGREIEILNKRTKEIELLIDKLSVKLPKITSFILPGGTIEASFMHFARTVCRRSERSVVLLSKKETVEKTVIVYLNRLSDALFIMARFINFKEGKKEEVWKTK